MTSIVVVARPFGITCTDDGAAKRESTLKSELTSKRSVRSTVLAGGGWLIVMVRAAELTVTTTGECCRAARDCASRKSAAITYAERFTRVCPSVWLTRGIRLATTTKMMRMTMTASKIVKPALAESPHSDSRALEQGVEKMVGGDKRQCPCRWSACKLSPCTTV